MDATKGPRIGPISTPSPEAAEALQRSPALDGRPLNIFATLAHHPQLLKRFGGLGEVFLRTGVVRPRDREIVVLRTAWRCGCEYEFGQHTVLAAGVGLDAGAVARLAAEGSAGWDPADATLVRMVDELHATDHLSDRLWEDLAEGRSPAELLELLALAGFYRMTAGLLNSARVEREAGIPGWPEPGGR